ncbi:hypothetical protein Efla_000925 [Eimeria flavescens]
MIPPAAESAQPSSPSAFARRKIDDERGFSVTFLLNSAKEDEEHTLIPRRYAETHIDRRRLPFCISREWTAFIPPAMDYAASVAAASAAANGGGASGNTASLNGDLLNSSLFEGFAQPAGAAQGRPPSFVVPPHPLEIQQKQYLQEVERQQLERASAAFGAHAALRLKTERELCATSQRLPGLPSSLWGLQVVMGLDDQIMAEDYLNRDKPEQEGGPLLTVHDRIERAMGV